MGSSPDGDLAQHGEVGVGQHGERDVAVPAGPGADLVLVEADLALGGLEAGLDRPARAGHLHQVGERGAVGGVGQVEGELVGARRGCAGSSSPFSQPGAASPP